MGLVSFQLRCCAAMALIVVGGCFLFSPLGIAQRESKSDVKARTDYKSVPLLLAQRGNAKSEKKSPGMSKAREAAALAFVREHHAELEQLLIQLKESQPRQYEKAVQDLFRTSERLTTIGEKDPQRHELELKAWQLKSRVQLLSATILMTPNDKQTRAKLKQALLDEAAVRREVLTLERNRLAKRLEKVESQIENLDKNADRMTERQIKLLLEGSPKQTTNKRVN